MKTTHFVTNGNPWGHPYAAKAYGPGGGGIITVRLNQSADTFFTWPGRASVNGKTVRGFVFSRDDGELEFYPSKAKANP